MDEEKQLPATANPDNLYWIMSEAKFMYLPTRTLFDRNAVIQAIGGEKAQVIEETKSRIKSLLGAGMPTFLENVAVIDGELFEHAGNSLLNLYKGPNVRVDGDANDVDFWLELGRFVFGDEMDHLIKVLAFKIQHPDQKVNHAIVIGSFDQGIGKDAGFRRYVAALAIIISATHPPALPSSGIRAASMRRSCKRSFREFPKCTILARIGSSFTT